MDASNDQKAKATFSYGSPTRAGKIPFTPPGTNLECETAYWLWGDLESKVPPLIVLHGGPGAPGRDWQPVAALNEKYGVPLLLYDQIGCGASTHLRHKKGDTSFWTNELFLAELDNVKSYLQIETFNLLGHSDGGIFAVLYALTQPQGLQKLVIASSPASEALRVQERLKQRRELSPEQQDVIAACEKEGRMDSPEYGSAMMELANRNMCRLDPWPPEVHEVITLMNEDDTVVSSLYGPFHLKATGPRKDHDNISRLPEITEKTVPGGVLLTNGRYDMTPDEVMIPFFTQIRARVKWVQFAESSHMAHVEEPEAFLTALGEFLSTP